ncbi:phage tail protein [Escherichia coli O157]|nr:phage tail protein [Escherichia coli O157]
MSTTYKTVITDKGAERITAALLPDGEKLKITHFAVGDSNGSTPTPDASQTALIHEVYRGEVSNIRIDVDDTTRIIVEGIIPTSQGGFWVREIGLYDDQGVLVAVCSAPERYKPVPTEGATSVLNCQVYVAVSNTDAIQLKVLDNAFLPDATTDTRGLTILSNDTESDDETKSATPKAVNDVRKQLPVVATDIRDRTDGRVALPGMFGFGAILTDAKHFSGNAGTSEFLTWIRTATPGAYQVSQLHGNDKIIPGVVFNGLIEIKYISSSRNSSGPQYEEKGIFFFGVNGDFWYNRYHTTDEGYLVGWENLRVDVEALRRLIALKADLNNPVFTGIPAAPTAAENDSSQQIANTEFVMRAIASLIDSSPEALNTLNELAQALGNDPNFATTITNALAGKQPLNALLTALSGLTTSANKFPFFTGADKVALAAITSTARALLSQSSVQGMQTTLGLTASLFRRFRGQLPTDANLDTYGPVEESVGIWSKQTSTNADVAHNFPEANAVGYIEVLPAGQFGGTQRYTVRTGNIYVRSLTASWNGIDGPWGEWLKVGNAATTATKLATARTIGGVSFDGTANIDLPGVNKAGNQNTSGNAATATKLQTARTISGVAFDGSQNITLTAKNVGATACPTGWLITGDNNSSITTSSFITLLQNHGAFNTRAWVARCSFAAADSAYIPDSETKCGIIPLAGAVIEVVSFGMTNYTIRVTTATTSSVSGAKTNSEFIYSYDNYNGSTNSPGWRRCYNSKNYSVNLSSYVTENQLTGYDNNLDIIANTLVVKNGSNGGFAVWDISTTTSGANMYISPVAGINNVFRSTSSRRYKKDIENITDEQADKVLEMRPVWYRSTCEADNKDWGWYGLIAEEVGEIAPQYVHWRDATEEDDPAIVSSNGLVAEGVMYERLVVPLIKQVQKLTTKVEALEEELKALKK